jgi:hypothetical protein
VDLHLARFALYSDSDEFFQRCGGWKKGSGWRKPNGSKAFDWNGSNVVRAGDADRNYFSNRCGDFRSCIDYGAWLGDAGDRIAIVVSRIRLHRWAVSSGVPRVRRNFCHLVLRLRRGDGTGTWPIEAILLGGQVGLLSAVLISVNNFRDREEDAKVGKKTLAVRFGPKFAAGMIWLEIKVAAFLGIVWLMKGYPLFGFASLPVFVIGMRIIWGVLTLPPGKEFNKLLALGALQLILFAAVFHVVAATFN